LGVDFSELFLEVGFDGFFDFIILAAEVDVVLVALWVLAFLNVSPVSLETVSFLGAFGLRFDHVGETEHEVEILSVSRFLALRGFLIVLIGGRLMSRLAGRLASRWSERLASRFFGFLLVVRVVVIGSDGRVLERVMSRADELEFGGGIFLVFRMLVWMLTQGEFPVSDGDFTLSGSLADAKDCVEIGEGGGHFESESKTTEV